MPGDFSGRSFERGCLNVWKINRYKLLKFEESSLCLIYVMVDHLVEKLWGKDTNVDQYNSEDTFWFGQVVACKIY